MIEFPNRVWSISKYVDENDQECTYDTLGARALWASREPTREDHLRRRLSRQGSHVSEDLPESVGEEG